MGNHVTIKDVAKKAGVSITTVSFVLNNRTDVAISEEVKKRVSKIARDMDYHPSAMAAGLAGKHTRNLGVIFYMEDSIISNQFYSFVIEGIVKETIEKGFNLFFSYLGSTYNGYQDLPKIIREKNVDGVLLIGRCDSRLVTDIKERRIPVVGIDLYPPVKGIETIQVENKLGALYAVEHLIKLGHKNIGLITIKSGKHPSIAERLDGYKTALIKNNLPYNKDLVFDCQTQTFQGGYDKAKEALQKNKKITALFCVNDEIAAGVLRAAREVGRDVPKNLSVVGFDNITMSNYTDPPLTTISVAKEYMGKLAVSRILEAIDDKDKPAQVREVPVQLVYRNSTDKPGN